jgi:hypothetical protein
MNYKHTILMIFGLATCLFNGFATAETRHGSPAHAVVELFTSQGCYSCPPADEVLRDLIQRRPDVVALEFHVDYWDELVYGSAGKWRDPFSDAAYTHRQRDYNSKPLGGRRGVYTPQMIVNGSRALVGSHGEVLDRELNDAERLPLDVRIDESQGVLATRIQGSYSGPAAIWLVEFIDTARTPVAGGENQGKFLHNHNIVTKLRHIGDWRGESRVSGLSRPQHPATRCAVLVQEPSGMIVGAAYCPI